MKASLFHSSAALILLVLALGSFLVGQSRSEAHVNAPVYDLIITNARIVDGSRNPWFRADVAVRDRRIVRIGRFAPDTAANVIDARGQILAPGFTDVHTHVESIYNLPPAENFIRMGVRSLVTANCGSSTTEVGEFLGRIKDKPLAVDLATLIARRSVRRKVIGLNDREPTPDELKQQDDVVAGADVWLPQPRLICEGFAADFVIFDDNTIADQATFDKPHQYPAGISYVIVNGQTVLANGQMAEARPGVSLRGGGYGSGT